ncbi:MAG: hypothetical protein ACJ74U_07390 [Jatrophihabitantaceae bacterium]
MVPIEAATRGDSQVLVARLPGQPGQPVIAIDGLAQAPEIDSLIVSTDIRLATPLPSVRELLLAPQTPMPTAGTLANLTGLRTLYAPWATTTRMLAMQALPAGLTELATHRGCLADVEQIGQLTGLHSLELDLYPGDSVAPIGKLAGLIRLRVGGPKVTGWRALAGCELLEEALLNGLSGTNLRPFAGWTRLRRLTITRRGLRSLAGVEAFSALEELDLRVMGIEDLSPLAGLPRLRSLRLIGLKAAHDLSPLAELPTLERLEVSRAGVEETDIVHVDSLRPLAGLDRLTEVVLSGTMVDDGDLAPLAGLPRLRRLVLYGPSGPTLAELRARPDLDLIVASGPRPAAATGNGLPIQVAPDGSWYLRVDLTERLDAETNYDAEEAIRTAVTGRDGELARRLSFDTEASAVTISAADRADLQAVAAIIDSLS